MYLSAYTFAMPKLGYFLVFRDRRRGEPSQGFRNGVYTLAYMHVLRYIGTVDHSGQWHRQLRFVCKSINIRIAWISTLNLP
jgi:hypothetical protein